MCLQGHRRLSAAVGGPIKILQELLSFCRRYASSLQVFVEVMGSTNREGKRQIVMITNYRHEIINVDSCIIVQFGDSIVVKFDSFRSDKVK